MSDASASTTHTVSKVCHSSRDRASVEL